MDSVETAAQYLQHHGTPYWWVMSGKSKIGECISTEDMNTSIAQFKASSVFWPAGSYVLECSDKVANRSGSFKLPFTKGQTTAATAQAMQPAQPSNNVYGIPDAVYQKIQAEERQRLLMEQMHGQFTAFIAEWPEYKKKIDKIDAFLKDEDGDGTPDLLENIKTATSTVSAVSEMGKVFKGTGKLFG